MAKIFSESKVNELCKSDDFAIRKGFSIETYLLFLVWYVLMRQKKNSNILTKRKKRNKEKGEKNEIKGKYKHIFLQ